MWLERPLQASLLSRAAGRVRYLSDLRIVTLHHLLAEFTTSVDVFLSCVRDMSDTNRSKAKVKAISDQGWISGNLLNFD